MARVTVEDCLKYVGNHFALVVLAAERARQLSRGNTPMVQSENRNAVTSLREISEGKISFRESVADRLEQYLQEMRQRGLKPTPPTHE